MSALRLVDPCFQSRVSSSAGMLGRCGTEAAASRPGRPGRSSGNRFRPGDAFQDLSEDQAGKLRMRTTQSEVEQISPLHDEGGPTNEGWNR
ncbi:hypothetical protein DTL21_08010 [Bremerella cremea]|uniref:Uncharacterized protein n=1 Tax=Blastopirellula marina TaxID=124 RepID=A0A2S8FUL3_9BACT|nr:hypothetical protein C5Y83_08005 [Blastopirellula marina]RCS48548.1 hypothetical protein DTL21_08010 [Bremerella cremea]